MKKILVVLLVLLCVGAAFAEGNPGVSIGAWGRGLMVVGPVGTDASIGTQVSWGGVPRIGITIASNNSANVGFQIDANTDGTGLGDGDNQKIWAKLLDGMITIQIGAFYDDTLRGNVAFGMHNWARLQSLGNAMNPLIQESGIFGRVGEAARANFEVSVSTSGLFAFVAFNGLEGSSVILADAMQFNGQYGAGYTIADIGTIRAQYIGAGTSAADASTIEAAFKLTAIKGLTVDLGVRYAMDDAVAGYTAKIPVFASYNMGTITILADGQFVVADPDSSWQGGIGADVDLGNGLGLNVDARFVDNRTDDQIDYGFGVGLTKGLGNGLIGVAIELANKPIAGFANAGVDEITWALPVRLEYWF